MYHGALFLGGFTRVSLESASITEDRNMIPTAWLIRIDTLFDVSAPSSVLNITITDMMAPVRNAMALSMGKRIHSFCLKANIGVDDCLSLVQNRAVEGLWK